MAPFIVCIDGLIGAGKSTLMKRLEKDYECFPEPLEKWTALDDFYKDIKCNGFWFQVQVLIHQYHQRQSFSDGLVIVERCPWTSRYVFAPLILNNNQLLDYDVCYRHFGYDVDRFIYLNVDPVEAFRRIEKRSLTDNLISLDYLRSLHRSYASNLLTGQSNVDVIEVSSPDDVEREVRAILAKINV